MNYILGLDIGITSVGWCVLDMDKEKIADLGVRLFAAAEKAGDVRTPARGARRRLRRKRQRMDEIRKLIVSSGIITQEQMEKLSCLKSNSPTPWELRARGLDELLSSEEWARVLIHIAKRRGCKFIRTAPSGDSEKNKKEGAMRGGVSANKKLLRNYRTVGEMMERDERFAAHKRNKEGSYICCVGRDDLAAEIKILFECQRGFGSPFASQEIQNKYTEICFSQLPFASGDQIEKMVERCTLEPDELRAPKASWTAERFVLLSKIANLRVQVNGLRMELGREKRKIIEELAYKNPKVTYKDIREAFNAGEEWTFENLPAVKNGDNHEDAVFAELKSSHALKKAVCAALKLKEEKDWDKFVSDSHDKLDILACALTFRKTDDDIKRYLEERGVEKELAESDDILRLNFSECVNLSLKAMKNLIPYMENEGCRYDEACVRAGYSHSEPGWYTKREKFLPVPDWSKLRSRTVMRSASQTRKVVNAIIRRYGSPAGIRIELARELTHSKEERKNIEELQNNNKKEKDNLFKHYHELYNKDPTPRQLERFCLWKAQKELCPYTGKHIDPIRAFVEEDHGYAEVDHIIPYSRSCDNGMSNKVLVMGYANREKQNRIPYEFLCWTEGTPDGVSGNTYLTWDKFVKYARSNIKDKRRLAKLLTKEFSDEESRAIKQRALDETRYVTKYMAEWMEKSLIFSDDSVKRPVARINGRGTAIIRRQWGLHKDRNDSDLHHALDACVIAAATPSLIQKISEYAIQMELGRFRGADAKDERRRLYPEPWPCFIGEMKARLSEDPAEKLMELHLKSYTEEELEQLKPIFISRKPERGAHGAAHEATIRSKGHDDCYIKRGGTVVKTPLTSVTFDKLKHMVGKERDKALYEALKKRLEEYGGKPDKAFAGEFRKPTKDGKPGPVVRSIKVFSNGTSGVPVRGGIANNGGMVRVDIYAKEKHVKTKKKKAENKKKYEYYLIPYYVNDITVGAINNKAIVADEDVNDWIEVDSSYDFVCSLYKNDLIKVISSKGTEIFGYYVGCDIATGAITVKAHDGSELWRGIGMRTAKSIEKYEVDVLGDYHKVKKEKPPHELA